MLTVPSSVRRRLCLNSLKQNRVTSFIIITTVYILAAIVGIDVYRKLTFDWWLDLLIADVASTVLIFVFSVVLGNASVYDPYWSVQPIVILAAFATEKEFTAVRVLLMAAVVFWGVRLTENWAYTFKNLIHQDWRYTMLKEKTGVFYPFVNFTGIHMVPTLIVYACTLPAAYAFMHEATWNVGSILFFGVSVGAAVMQGIADHQMHSFQKHGTGDFIRDGLWKYSRHPNYLGEILMWWGVAFSVLSVFPHVWYLGIGALANTVLFLFVSIPLADGHQSRKPKYEEYESQTRMLLPFKRYANIA